MASDPVLAFLRDRLPEACFSTEVAAGLRADVEQVEEILRDLQGGGTVYLEETQLTMQEFEESFPQLAAAGTFQRVYIRGDSLARHGAVMHVVTTIARTGKQFSFVVEQREERR